MKLLIVRHAAAVERSTAIAEEMRYLTPAGRAFMRKTARTLQKKRIDPALIVTSPLVRAVQTADILAETIAYGGPMVVRDEVGPGFGLPALRGLLTEFPPVGELVIVGHEPDLSGVIAALLALPGGFSFKKGAAVKLRVDPAALQATAVFKWLAVGDKLLMSREEAFAQ